VVVVDLVDRAVDGRRLLVNVQGHVSKAEGRIEVSEALVVVSVARRAEALTHVEIDRRVGVRRGCRPA
jgi:hypothetical protein